MREWAQKIKRDFFPIPVQGDKKRIEYIDLLKLVAAFLTTFYHFAHYKLDYGFSEELCIYLPNVSRIVMCVASCCVPLFFMVNGALLLNREHNWKSIYKKVIKIVVLICVYSHFVDVPIWFFKTLAILYILFPVLQYAYRKKRFLYHCLIGLLLVFPFGYNMMLLILKIVAPELQIAVFGKTVSIMSLGVDGCYTMYSIVYFFLGAELARKNTAMCRGMLAATIGVFLVTAECVIYTNLNGTMYDGVNAAFPTYGALMLSVGVFVIIKKLPLEKFAEQIRWASESVLSIYVLHMFVIRLVGSMAEFGCLHLPVALLISFFIFFICVVLGKIANRIPLVCWLVRI